MSRKSALSRYANSLDEPELPLRTYFLSAGGALLLLLQAADWVLPAPLPSRLTDSDSARPPIRIQSELKGPEAVVFDTSGFEYRSTSTGHESAEAPSLQPETEVADAVAGVGDDRPTATIELRLRESLARLQPGVQEHARHGGSPHQIAARRSAHAQARLQRLRRSARYPGFQTSRQAFVPN
ncbi:hypothetical protein Bra471DRAFT_00532 [Bradyrhizobium sp. WSM471]|nr:hypothetical protein Bra471DRAFT_00532 [Bradyrhizobium sp. WSM471]